MIDPNTPIHNGVYILSPVQMEFEAAYIKLRKKEIRLYSDAEVRELPNTFLYNLHRQEWEVRAKSHQRIMKYLKKKPPGKKILDLGCGNGWLCGHIAKIEKFEVTGLDINLNELEQAARVFSLPNLRFCYGDIFEEILSRGYFDLIIINSSIQYFPNLKQLINRCREYLKKEGELHIYDSPLYAEKDIEAARERSLRYYQGLQSEEMAQRYFHHSKQELAVF